MRRIEEEAARAFAERFGEAPELVASAPGRVNLIGEHTDYNGGFVLPCAIDRRIACAVGPTSAGEEGILFSTNFDEERLLEDYREDSSWADYPRGIAWALAERGVEMLPFRATFVGNVPPSSGLSSSAALEAATAIALDGLFGFEIPKKDTERGLADTGYEDRRLVYDSHLSLRDDFEVSTRELDTFVETARESGALGARLTGAGFGGCAIALVAASEADTLTDFTWRRFEGKDFKEPVFYEFKPVSGAEVAG